jgi:hypothetical protein
MLCIQQAVRITRLGFQQGLIIRGATELLPKHRYTG